jgi:hypothetical protein
MSNKLWNKAVLTLKEADSDTLIAEYNESLTDLSKEAQERKKEIFELLFSIDEEEAAWNLLEREYKAIAEKNKDRKDALQELAKSYQGEFVQLGHAPYLVKFETTE